MRQLYVILSIVFLCSFQMFGQEKEMKSAIKKGKEKGKDYYYVYPSTLTTEKYNEWAKKQKDYKVFGTKTENQLLFGSYKPCISEISFLPLSEIEQYEKMKAHSIPERINIRRKYPDYRIKDWDDETLIEYLLQGYYSPKRTVGFMELKKKDAQRFDNFTLEEFLLVFPEYKDNPTLKKAALGEINVKSFITIFGLTPEMKQYLMDVQHGLGGFTLMDFIQFT